MSDLTTIKINLPHSSILLPKDKDQHIGGKYTKYNNEKC